LLNLYSLSLHDALPILIVNPFSKYSELSLIKVSKYSLSFFSIVYFITTSSDLFQVLLCLLSVNVIYVFFLFNIYCFCFIILLILFDCYIMDFVWIITLHILYYLLI